MCPSEAACLQVVLTVTELELKNPTKNVDLVQRGHPHLIEILLIFVMI